MTCRFPLETTTRYFFGHRSIAYPLFFTARPIPNSPYRSPPTWTNLHTSSRDENYPPRRFLCGGTPFLRVSFSASLDRLSSSVPFSLSRSSEALPPPIPCFQSRFGSGAGNSNPNLTADGLPKGNTFLFGFFLLPAIRVPWLKQFVYFWNGIGYVSSPPSRNFYLRNFQVVYFPGPPLLSDFSPGDPLFLLCNFFTKIT